MLSDFAKHTRQPQDEDLTTLAKKYLAVHCSLAPMPLVYAHLADDYKLLEMRTHQPNIHHYSQFGTFDKDAFVKIMRDGYAHLQGPINTEGRPALSYFLDTLFPKPVGSEAWQEWQQNDHWRKRALFMALNCNEKAGFHELVREVLQTPTQSVGVCNDGGENGSDHIDDMCTKLHKIKLSGKMPEVTPQELASIIGDLDMFKVEDVALPVCDGKGDNKTPVSTTVAKDDSEILPLTKQKLSFTAATASEATAFDPTLLNAYRKRANLPATLTPLRIAKQLLFSAMQLKGDEHASFEKLKTSDQTQFVAFNKDEDKAALQHCVDALIDKQKLTSLLNAHAEEPAFVSAPIVTANKGNDLDSAQFLKSMIDAYASPPQGATAYVKKYHKPCEALINVILGL